MENNSKDLKNIESEIQEVISERSFSDENKKTTNNLEYFKNTFINNININSSQEFLNDNELLEIEFSSENISNPQTNSGEIKQITIKNIRKLANFNNNFKNKYYVDNLENNSLEIKTSEGIDIYESSYELGDLQSEDISRVIEIEISDPAEPGCGMKEIPEPKNYSITDGYGHANIERAFEILKGIEIPDKESLGGDLWGLDNIGAPEVWNGSGCFEGVTGKDVIVAVCDTGIDYNHSEFAGRIVDGYDFVNNDNDATDGHGHGTHCSGTIAGANDGIGITGVAYDAKIMPIKVLSDGGWGFTSWIVSGIRSP